LEDLVHKPLAFIDTETTGLDPTVHEVIEFAAIKVTPQGQRTRYHTLIKPEHIETAHPKALQVNGYADDPSRWEDAPPLAAKADEISLFLANCILVGHNVSFDEAMLKGSFAQAGLNLSLPHRKIDTITLVYEHLFPLGLRTASLDATRAFLGWSVEGGHRAEKDAEDAERLYRLLSCAGTFRRFYIWVGHWARALR